MTEKRNSHTDSNETQEAIKRIQDLSAWKSNEIKWAKKKDWQLKSFEELVVLFLGPALSGLGDGVGLPDLLARPVWGRSHWLGSRRAGLDHVACFALLWEAIDVWLNEYETNKQTSKQKAKVWRAGLLRNMWGSLQESLRPWNYLTPQCTCLSTPI